MKTLLPASVAFSRNFSLLQFPPVLTITVYQYMNTEYVLYLFNTNRFGFESAISAGAGQIIIIKLQ